MIQNEIGSPHRSGAIPAEDRHIAESKGANFLCLAAAPVFASMALLIAIVGSSPDLLCAGTMGAAPLSGMAPMYLLMSAFHVASWLRLFSNSRG